MADDLGSVLAEGKLNGPVCEDLFASVPGFLTVQDRDLKILFANKIFTEKFGEARGRYCYQVYKGRDSKCDDCPVERTFLDGQSHNNTQKVLLPDGQEIPTMAFTSPVLGPDGRVTAVVELSVDITPVKRLEGKLRESRERFRLLFEEVPCYMSVQDRDLRIVQTNRKFKEDFGSYIGAYCYEVYKHRGEPCLICPVAQTFQDGQTHHSEEMVTSLSGEKIHTLVSTAPVRNNKGEIDHVIEMSTNITQIRDLQGQLTNLGLLVGSISHGIKGLLTGLDGGMYLMNTGLDRKDQGRIEEGWGMIRRNVEHIRSVVLDLLYIAKEREPQWERVDLRELAASVSGLFRKRAQDMVIEFHEELETVGAWEVDTKSLHASLVNILENAFDACRVDQRKESHSVSFRLTANEDHALFEIEDDGVGMDRETRQKVFSLFFSSKGSEGTGLGLFIANKVVEKHGGTIEVDSEPGRGTRFTIRLPKTREALPQ